MDDSSFESSSDIKLALQNSGEWLRLFVQHVPAAIAMFDTNMRYLVVSQNWLTTYGIKKQDIIGRSHYEIFPDLPDRWKEVHRRCLSGSVERREEDQFVWLDGSTKWVTWEVRPWHTVSGTVGGIIIFSQDVTAHRQAEEGRIQLHREVILEKEKLSALINSISDEIWFADKDGNFTIFNPAARHEFKLDAATAAIDVKKFAATLEVFHPNGTPRSLEEAPPPSGIEGGIRRQRGGNSPHSINWEIANPGSLLIAGYEFCWLDHWIYLRRARRH